VDQREDLRGRSARDDKSVAQTYFGGRHLLGRTFLLRSQPKLRVTRSLATKGAITGVDDKIRATTGCPHDWCNWSNARHRRGGPVY
jgi:hypothetical protein